jgi:cysteinyl-tRNA synthetase
LHSGHLHIEGQKMSKSLKNFVTIREALNKYTSAQIRFMFLLHAWDNVLDYKDSSMEEAKSVETKFRNFFEYVKGLGRIKQNPSFDENGVLRHDYYEPEKELMNKFLSSQKKVHEALCDNLNTPIVISELLDLVSSSYIYDRTVKSNKKSPNLMLMQKIAKYVTRLLKIFGVFDSGSEQIGQIATTGDTNVNAEDVLLPYLNILATFRGNVREMAKGQAGTLGKS